MAKMRRYRTHSYSEQARAFADRLIAEVKCYNSPVSYKVWVIANSYRAPLVRQRAIKRFVKKMGVKISDITYISEDEMI